MSKCNLPPRQVDAIIDGVARTKLFDACNGKYLGSVIDEPRQARPHEPVETTVARLQGEEPPIGSA